MPVEMIRGKDGASRGRDFWRMMVHLGLRYGWQPLGARPPRRLPAGPRDQGGETGPTGEARGGAGFDESTWLFDLDRAGGIPPRHPLAYCSDVLFFCEDPVLGWYFADGRVRAADARALAAALEKALPHMPEVLPVLADHKTGALFNPTEWRDPRDQKLLGDLIAFLKGGGFELIS